MQNSLIYNNGNHHNYPTSLLKRWFPYNNPETFRKGNQDCLYLGYLYMSLPDQGQVLAVVIIRLQLSNTFYLLSSLAKVWNPFINTNINLDLIWDQKMSLTYLSTTMFASCYVSPIHNSKCSDIVCFHSEVLYDSINSFESIVSCIRISYLSRSLMSNTLQPVAPCIHSLDCNEWKHLCLNSLNPTQRRAPLP